MILLIIGGYLGIALYYASGFSFGTWINGIYCTGKTVEEVNSLLLEKTQTPSLFLEVPLPESEDIACSKVIYLEEDMAELDYRASLKKILMRQSPLAWYRNMLKGTDGITLSPEVILTEKGKKKLREEIGNLSYVKEQKGRAAELRLCWDDREGYALYNGKENRLDADMIYEQCVEALEKGQSRPELTDGIYYDEKLTAEDKKLIETWEALRQFMDFELVYDMGTEQVVMDKKALSEMIATGEGGITDFVLDENGGFLWDEEKIEETLNRLADSYDTYGRPRDFTTTDGKVVRLEKGTYGTELDREAELIYFKQALENHVSETHVPAYKRQAWARGLNDIGDTYIEVNMTKQVLYYYRDGVIEIETPVVTGNMLLGRDTPEGVYYVYSKQKNRILRGPGYASHVNYWMPVKNGIGIHDALWRDEFGGDIYQNSGSHGCINTPLEAMEKMYEMTEVGIPVILYYED